MSLEDIYKDAIMDHYARPRGRGKLEHPVIIYHAHNPTCGDEIEVQANVEDGRIQDVRFSGHGCSISQASASMMTVAMKGKTLPEAKATLAKFLGMMRGEPGSYKELGEVQALQGVSRLPVRLKCATLAWHALEVGLSQHESGQSQRGPVHVLESKDL